MLNTNGVRRGIAANQPATPSGSGGDMTMTTSGRIRVKAARTVAMPVKPAKATARAGMLVLSVGKGWSRVIQPHGVDSVRAGRPVQPSSTAWWRYHGSAVTTCRRCPRAARASTMAVITSPVGATSGA